MITIKTDVNVNGISAQDVCDFMMNCTDQEYQDWWRGTHLEFHTIKRFPDEIGNLVYFDEYVGKRRLKFEAVVTKFIPGKQIVWQMKKAILLPAWLILEFEDNDIGVRISHTLKAGFSRAGTVFDPFIKVYLSKEFEKEMNEHAHIEFTKLAYASLASKELSGEPN